MPRLARVAAGTDVFIGSGAAIAVPLAVHAACMVGEMHGRRMPPAHLGLAVLAIAGAVAGPAFAAAPRGELLVVRTSVNAERTFPGGPSFVPPFAYLVNRGGPLEVEVRRVSGTRRWEAVQVLDGARVALPAGVPVGPKGFGRAVEVTVLDRARRVVARRALNLCVNAGRVRLGPSGPALSAFPDSCTYHPFSRGVRLGLDGDHGVPLGVDALGRLPAGRFTIRLRVRPALAEWLGMAPARRAVEVRLRVPRLPPPAPEPEFPDGEQPTPVVTGETPHREPRYRPRPAAAPPASDVVPPADTLPNLAGLPAYDVTAQRVGRRDTLEFAATVWNTGPGPLIVEGHRPSAAPVMNGFQFFRRAGEDVTAVPVAQLEYDDREGHDHWHFRDFARYALVRADGRQVRRSPKEAWCLAPTDQIDQLVPNAEIRPGNPLLATACGDGAAVQVREVLEVGAGDTYGRGTPGQAIDITRVPNGVYFLKIEANPAGVLRETTTADNIALRRIVLGGTRGRRTVRVPPVEGIDTERPGARCAPFCGLR